MIKKLLLPMLCLALCITGLIGCNKNKDGEPSAAPVADIDLDRSEVSLKIGESIGLVAAVLPGDADKDSLTWYSTDKSVVTVKHGTVTAVSSGSAVIVCASSNGIFAKCIVTVAAEAHVHSFGDWTETLAPTCKVEGKRERTCSSCQTVESEVIARTEDHVPEEKEVSRTEPTCTTAGSFTMITTCSVCTQFISSRTGSISKTDHSLGAEVVTTAPTCTRAGVGYKGCTNEGCTFKQETRPAALDHLLIDVKGQAPTCQKTGISDYKKCTRDGCNYNTKTTLPKDPNAHAYAIEEMLLIPPTETTPGMAIFECGNDGCTFIGTDITIPALNSTAYTKTELADGSILYSFKYNYNGKMITITFTL